MNEIFKIFKVDPIESKKIEQTVNEPHQHDFEELLIGKQGRLEHFIDFTSQSIPAPFVSFVTQGKVHRVKPLQDKVGNCDIWVIRFKSEFISETTFRLYSSFHDNANIKMLCNNCFVRMESICKMMYEEYDQSTPDYSVIRQLLSTLFTMIDSERHKLNLDNDETKKIQGATFKNFLKILEKNYRQPLGVDFYASQLFMTSRNLNLICQNILQQSVSEIIETRKLTEAKNLLVTTDLPIADIGYTLGFKEKTYFTHAFKKKAGVSPREFREDMSKFIS